MQANVKQNMDGHVRKSLIVFRVYRKKIVLKIFDSLPRTQSVHFNHYCPRFNTCVVLCGLNQECSDQCSRLPSKRKWRSRSSTRTSAVHNDRKLFMTYLYDFYATGIVVLYSYNIWGTGLLNVVLYF